MLLLQQVLDIADARLNAIFGKAKPIQCSNKAQWARSVLLADMEEAEAKVASLKLLEQAQRGLLTAALGALAYAAERAKYRIESAQWIDAGPEVIDAMALVQAASLKQNSMLDSIDTEQKQIKAMQTRLNDADFWQGVK
jgi:hypothetical protein